MVLRTWVKKTLREGLPVNQVNADAVSLVLHDAEERAQRVIFYAQAAYRREMELRGIHSRRKDRPTPNFSKRLVERGIEDANTSQLGLSK